jgi:hypothetical protein
LAVKQSKSVRILKKPSPVRIPGDADHGSWLRSISLRSWNKPASHRSNPDRHPSEMLIGIVPKWRSPALEYARREEEVTG